MAKLVQDLSKGHPQVGETPGQGADTHSKLVGDRLGLGFSSAKQSRDDPLDPMPQIRRAVLPANQDLLAVAGQEPVQPFVRRRKRQGKLASREGQRIVSRAETNGTAEEPLELCDFVVA